MLKAVVRPILNRIVVRERFNDSRLYTAYVSLFRPEAADNRRKELRFYEAVVGRNRNLIFDIGASGGHKAAIFRQLADHVVSVEPGQTALETLKRRFCDDPRVTIVPEGIGAAEGHTTLHVFHDAEACNTVSGKHGRRDGRHVRIEVTTLDRMIQQFGLPHHINIEVNGSEAAALRGLSRSIPIIGFACNLPEFADETVESINRLVSLSPDARFQYVVGNVRFGFAASAWLSTTEMVQIVRKSERAYLEFFCWS